MKTILLVDDQPHISKMIAIKLEKMGYKVLFAENGKIGIKVAKQSKPDLIIMDIMMPEMDGFSAVSEIRNDPEIKDTAVIFLSAKGQDSDKKKAQELNAVDFVCKPFSPKDLTDIISKHL